MTSGKDAGFVQTEPAMAARSDEQKMGPFAESIFLQKYAHQTPDAGRETWSQAATRIVGNIMAPLAGGDADRVLARVTRRQLMPGGRAIYCAGRRFHQTNNCFLFFADDSREGWADLMRKVTSSLMTGGGVGVVYSPLRGQGVSVGGMGGVSSGPVALMEMVNEVGRRVKQGGSRRSAIWAGLHWNHPDIDAFIHLKDWPEWMV